MPAAAARALRAGRPADAVAPRDRRASCCAPPVASGGSCSVPTPVVTRAAAHAGDAACESRAPLDLGRGRAARGVDDERARTGGRRAPGRHAAGDGCRARPLAQRAWPAIRPRQRRLELCRERQQRALLRRTADELDGERQAIVARVERQRDRGLAGHVADRRERRERARARERRAPGAGLPGPARRGVAAPVRARA